MRAKNKIISITAITAVVFMLTLLCFCMSCVYLTKQGTALARYSLRRERIDNLLSRDDLSDEKRNFLNRVLDIRAFAIDSIGLRRNKNYTMHVQADRDYMVDVVVASRDDSFALKRWWFPITGSMPYKGFFDRRDAEREARRIERRGGYDVHIGRAGAFSTLGIMSDPVYSFMMTYDVYDLASLIIHEQTHATIWIKGDAQLNEEIATFVGDVGALWYVRDRFGEDSEEYRSALLQKEDYRTYIDLLRDLYNTLNALYERDDANREYKLARKEEIFDGFRTMVANDYDSLFHTRRYVGLSTARLNNAVIASRMTYNLDMALFYELYAAFDNDLAAVVYELKKLSRVKRDHKDHIRGVLAERAQNRGAR